MRETHCSTKESKDAFGFLILFFMRGRWAENVRAGSGVGVGAGRYGQAPKSTGPRRKGWGERAGEKGLPMRAASQNLTVRISMRRWYSDL